MIPHMKYLLNLAAYSCLLLYAVQSHAQNFSQDWANYNTYLDMAKDVQTEGRVHEFSGAVTSAFNFYSISLDGQSFPVGINYFSNGIKVDEYASAVGLGWNLSAGGSITKVTRGLDDDESVKGYNIKGAPPVNEQRWRDSCKKEIYKGTRDGEKDYYVFNAFGLSGTFVYHNGSYLPMGGEKIDVAYSASPSPSFTIKDHSGNSYFFTLQETIYTYSYDVSNLTNAVKGNWFLTRVLTSTNKEILLTYEDKTITGLKTYFSETDGIADNCELKLSANITIYNTYASHRIKGITTQEETITFFYNNRTDAPGTKGDKALAGIAITKRGSAYKNYLLNQGYLSGRLMLNAIVDKNHTTQQEITLAEFTYYNALTMTLPMSEEGQDEAGYFNGTPYPWYLSLPKSLLPNISSSNIANGADRNIASAETIQTLLLKKITDQYGKIQEFSYERNTWSELVPSQNGDVWVTHINFGVRVGKITTYDKTQPLKKKYVKYEYVNAAGNPSGILTNSLSGLIMQGSVGACSGVVRKSRSSSRNIRVLDFTGVYTAVKTLVYTDDSDINGSLLGYHINEYSKDENPIKRIIGNALIGNFSVWMVFKNRWGQLISAKIYSKTGQLVDESLFTYEDVPNGSSFINMYTFMGSMSGGTPDVSGQVYEHGMEIRRLKTSIHKTYSPTAELLLTEKKAYTYDALNYVSQLDVYRNNVLKESTTFKRPIQYTLSAGSTDKHIRAVQEMNARKMYSPVLETVTWRKDVSPEVVLSASATLYQYDFTRSIILPAVSFTHRSAAPVTSFTPLSITNNMVSLSSTYARASEVLTYDKYLLPVETKTEDLVYTSSYFDKEGRLLCAFSNAALSNTAFLGFEPYELDKIKGGSASGQAGWGINNPCSSNNSNVTPGVNPVFLHNGGYTGNYAFDFSTCTNSELVCSRPLSDKKSYVLQFWQKTGKGTSTPDGTGPPKVLKKVQDWELVEYELSNITSLRISGTGIIDDVRLFPVEATYAYTTYNAIGLKTSECDGSGECIFYEYDEHYRLRTVKDARGDILKRMEYGIQEQQ